MTDNFYTNVNEILRTTRPFFAKHILEEEFFNHYLSRKIKCLFYALYKLPVKIAVCEIKESRVLAQEFFRIARMSYLVNFALKFASEETQENQKGCN